LLAIGFFVTFTTISSFVVLSLFVGTITLGMIEATQLLDDIVDMQDAHTTHRHRYTHTWLPHDAHYEPVPGRRRNEFMYDDSTPGEGIPLSTDPLHEDEQESERPGLVLVGDHHLGEGFLRRMSQQIVLQGTTSITGGNNNDAAGRRSPAPSMFSTPSKDSARAARGGGIARSGDNSGTQDDPYSFDEDERERGQHLKCFKSWPKGMLRSYMRLARTCRAVSQMRWFEVRCGSGYF
jgi:hypothetical protein